MEKSNKIVVKGITRTNTTRNDSTFVGGEYSYANVSINVDQIPVEVTLTDKDIKAIGDRYLELLTKKRSRKQT